MSNRPLIRLIYANRSRGAAVQHAVSMRRAAELHNRSAAITGALVATNDRFLQVLEGPSTSVRDVYRRIEKDPRQEHCRTCWNPSPSSGSGRIGRCAC